MNIRGGRKMTWKERINVCKKLLADIRDMIPEEHEDEKELFSLTLDNLGDFTASEAFLENGEEEKEMDSWNILINTLMKCNDCMDIISHKLYPNPPKYITQEQAYQKLLEEYMNGMKEGDDTVASMNINDWVADNGYIIVDEDDERLEKPDDSDDSGTVNSRTKF